MFLFSNKIISSFGSISLWIWNKNNVRSDLNPDFDKSPSTGNNQRYTSRRHAADSPSMSSLILLLLLLVNLCTNGVAMGAPGEEKMVVIGARVETKHEPMHVVSATCSVTWFVTWNMPEHACDLNQLENARQLLPTTNGDGGETHFNAASGGSKIYDFV